MKTITRSLAALAACALLAACGGGGGAKTSALPGAAATSTPSAGGQQLTSGARLTVTIPHATAHTSAHARKGAAQHRIAAAKRSPKYFSRYAAGLQVTTSSPGVTSVTTYYDTTGADPNCVSNYSSTTCTLTIPALAQSESLSVVEVDSEPLNVNGTTGTGSGFPSTAKVLAVGTVPTFALTAGAVTPVTVSMNPVIASFENDCGDSLYDVSNAENISVDSNTHRVTVTANVASTGKLQTEGANDADGNCIDFHNSNGNTAQPWVDVNGTSVPVTATSNSTHMLLVADVADQAHGGASPNPVPAQVASFPDTSYQYGCFDINLRYDGTDVATATGGPTTSTIVLNNNLTATPPPFSGVSGASYAATATYQVVPIDAYPATLNGAGTVTGYDAGADADGMSFEDAPTGNSCTGQWTITPGTYANGTQPFVVTQGTGAGGPCTFTVSDGFTGTISRTISILPPP